MTCNDDVGVTWDDQMTENYRLIIMQTHLVIWNLHLALGNLPKTPYLGKMTKFGNLVPKKVQNTKKGLELVMPFLTLPGVLTTLMAHYQTALVRPLYKKSDQDKIQNYRPVSILNGFSKV